MCVMLLRFSAGANDVYYPQEALTNSITSTTDTRHPHACTHICAPGAPPDRPSKGSISGEKGWGAMWASG